MRKLLAATALLCAGDVHVLTTSTVTDNTINTFDANGNLTSSRVDFPPPSCH
jgi:hypothetical protein